MTAAPSLAARCVTRRFGSVSVPAVASMVGRDDMVFEDAVIAHLLGERSSISREVGS